MASEKIPGRLLAGILPILVISIRFTRLQPCMDGAVSILSEIVAASRSRLHDGTKKIFYLHKTVWAVLLLWLLPSRGCFKA